MTKKLLVALACAAALSIAALVGCSSGGSDIVAGQTPEEGMNFVVGFDHEYPPYGYVGDDGEYTGFDLELAQEVCNRNGWNYVPTPINWDTKLTELNAGAYSCIWNGFTMEGREADYTFSKPYMDNGQVIMVKADSDIKTLDDLKGKVVATQVDSAALEVLTEGDRAELAATFGALEERSDYNIAVTELEAGAIDAVACDLSIAMYNMAKNPDKYVLLDEYLSQEHYAVAFKQGNEELADAVNATLKEMTEDGFVEQLCEKYAEDGISFENWVLK